MCDLSSESMGNDWNWYMHGVLIDWKVYIPVCWFYFLLAERSTCHLDYNQNQSKGWKYLKEKILKETKFNVSFFLVYVFCFCFVFNSSKSN